MIGSCIQYMPQAGAIEVRDIGWAGWGDGAVPDAVPELGGRLGGGGLGRAAGLLQRGDVGRLLLAAVRLPVRT
ncbi:hypothetical protein ACF1BU_37070 [Streptomyces sp. NPDC014724]|uniref:hypothetical protein n=1 Tax=unclassified Streptomyces TaxID=2593676 RepID=UPI0036FBA75A